MTGTIEFHAGKKYKLRHVMFTELTTFIEIFQFQPTMYIYNNKSKRLQGIYFMYYYVFFSLNYFVLFRCLIETCLNIITLGPT